ncbi:MAG: S41 family peptidase [Spirosomataceae bacterium]
MKKYKKYVLGCSLLASVGMAAYNVEDKYFELAKNLDIFATLYKEVNTLYVDELNPAKMIRVGIEAMLAQLDPYTNFYPEDDIEEVRTMSTGKFNGIGATLTPFKGSFFVTTVYKDSPADVAGIKIGDEVLAIGKISVTNRNELEVSRLLKGQTGTNVRLTLKRYGAAKPIFLDVARGIVKTPNVPHYGMVNEEVGYIQLTDFSPTAASEIKDAFEELKAAGMKKVILDLRNNPGGLLNMSIDICNFFLPKGQTIVETRGRLPEWNKVYKAMNNPLDTEIPVAVLINSGSASASEIVSGTLQDYDRAVVIGQQSFGKGLVQITKDLSFNAKLKVTTAKYYTPSGRCIQAVDYSNRKEDGSVGKIADSLRRSFTTQAGRIVYDGGGVQPDVVTAAKSFSVVTNELLKQRKIFDFATRYYHENGTTTIPGKGFFITDETYNSFVEWLVMQNFSYVTPLEKQLLSLKKTLEESPLKETVNGEIKAIEQKIRQDKQQDLKKYKEEIRDVLSMEIIGRYHYQNTAKFIAFEKDVEVQTAVSILQNSSKYAELLRVKK